MAFTHLHPEGGKSGSRYFKSQPRPVAKNATLGHPTGNPTSNFANVVRYSANGADYNVGTIGYTQHLIGITIL